MQVELPDGSKREVPDGATVADVAASIGRGLAKAAIAGKVNGKVVDVYTPVYDNAKIEIVTPKSEAGLDTIRHSTAHLMAMAVQELFPGTQVTIGPVIDNGFFYDFGTDRPFTDDDLRRIEEKMSEIVKRDLPVRREVVSRDEAIAMFEKLGEKYKVEIIKGIPGDEPLSVYHQGEWFDLCRGPHVPSTGRLGAFKLTSVAGAYWRGDEHNAMLQRIYGTAWADKDELSAYLTRIEEAHARDHRKLGKQLGLFMFSNFAPSMPVFLPKGAAIYNELVDFVRKFYLRDGYSEVVTPLIWDTEIFKISGHYDNYKDNMFFSEVDEREYGVKPMNCPGHTQIFAMERRSYRDLPIRYADFARLHRYERSGVTHGLVRVRSFAQDDAHLFVTDDQIESEIDRELRLIKEIYDIFDFKEVRIALSTRPEKRLGDDAMWDNAESALENALKKNGVEYHINPGEGAFYGPKLEFQVTDAIGRPWQLGTIQLDYALPERFQLRYIGADNAEHQPVMIHRAILGSIERFIGIIIEHFAGAFPLWLAPVQASVLPLSEKFLDYGRETAAKIRAAGLRVEMDDSNEKLGAKIRDAQLKKIPYMLVVGEKEVAAGTVSVRKRTGGEQLSMSIDEFVAEARRVIAGRSLTL
ncbi:MAG: threonine--tRNA ligase [Acidobacteria bacterium]|nr:threonine--tRNA ligase [Acidobacteriota bacterium]MBV9069504.1 threonine--tRNA ligase [Acidobacteriota bacterium]MBV9185943.1 threonine--tRNA ligase [Acidobacteriota bacterium]